MKWEVRTWSLFGGWENSWWLDDRPQTFETYAEAEAEVKEYIEESEDLVAQGLLEEPYSWEDYRIEEVL